MWIYDLWGKGDCWKASTRELKSLLSRRLRKTRFVGIMEAEFESNILVIKEGRVNVNGKCHKGSLLLGRKTIEPTQL